MRRLLLSAALWTAAAGSGCLAQTPHPAHDAASLPQIPFGQVYKDFQFPSYQNGALNATLSAVSARGVTMNRAETTELKIDLYTNGKVTTTITSPKADLYVADRKMRTKNGVHIVRADLDATSDVCDFDLPTKKYLLRQNVKVVLKNFDAGAATKTSSGKAPPAAAAVPLITPAVMDVAAPLSPASVRPGEGTLDFPGAAASTNTAPSSP